MAQTPEDIKWLYGKLKAKGYDIGNEQEFTNSLANENDRKWYYEKATGMGLDMGSMDDFNSLYAPAPTSSAPQQPAQPTATVAPASAPASVSEQAVQSAPEEPTQPAWQPNEQDQIRMSYQMHNMLNDFNQKSKARLEQIQRLSEPFTPEGRKKRRELEFQERLAGTPTKVMGLTPPSSAPASDGAQGEVDGAAQPQPVQSGQSPVPYGVKYIDGKPVTQWLLPDGRLTTSLIEADQTEYGARTARLRHQFENRMKQNGLDPAKPEDVEMQAQYDAQAPAYDAVADLWRETEARHKADRNRNADRHWDRYSAMGGGREMSIVTTSMNRHDDNISHMTRFDIEKMMDNAWNRVGSRITANCYNRLRQQYPGASEEELRATASEMARSLSDNAVYQYAVQQNTPKSILEYFGRTVTDMNVINSISKGLARSQAGTSGDLAAYEAAMGEYGKNHRVAQVAGTVVGMAVDPVTWVSGGVGSLASKGALNLGGRFLASRAAGMTTQMGSRLFGSSLTGRIIVGSAGAAGNLATYEGLKEAESQWLHGGHVNAETGEVEGYSAGEILKSTGHGMLMGSVIGPLSPVIGNVGDKAVRATTSTMGKVGVRGGEIAVSTLAEGTIFSVPQWISGEGDAFDIWTDNMAMMLGFKAQHGIKSAPRVIASLRPIKPVDGRPLTQAERNHNRMDFEERLRRNLDASSSDLSFTADEREELRRTGYGELADLFSRDRVQEVQRPDVDPAEGAIELRAERVEAETVHRSPEFDGYSAMEELMQDGRVSQAARAKAYYILTGRMLPMGTVTGYTTTTTEDGRVMISATTADGEIVTTRTFKNEQESRQEVDNIMRQAELNSVDVGERYKEAVADDMVLDAAISEVSPGADPATIKKIYRAVKAGNKDVTESQVQLAEFLDDAIARNKDIADKYRPEAIREELMNETGIDVDAVLRKMPSKRTEAEQEAVKSYLERLFPEEARQQTAEPTPEQAEAQSHYEQGRELYGHFEEGDPTVQAEVDAIALRMQEAYQAVEDAFGSEAEYYMFHVNENPWALVDDPELTVEQKDAVLYYINAKAALDGVMDASNEASDRKRTEVEESVAKRTHKDKEGKDDGTIITAETKMGKHVYIVMGDVVMFPDGKGVDRQNSSSQIWVLNPDSGEYESSAPEFIEKILGIVSVQDELDTALSVIEQEQMNIFGDNAVAPENSTTGGEVQQLDEIDLFAQPTEAETSESVPNSTENPEIDAESSENPTETVPNPVEIEAAAVTALSRIPINEQGEPMFEAVDKDTAWDGLVEAVGGAADAADIAMAQVQQATSDLEALKKKTPTQKAPKLKGSPMAMAQAKREAAEQYQRDLAQYNQQIADTQVRLDAWNGIIGVYNSRNAELRRQQEEERRMRDAYLSNYEPGWTGLGAITHVSKDEFKKWIQSSRRKTKPFAEYKSVKPIEGNGMIGRSLTEQEATELIERMETTAEVAPTIELTPENWIAQFGEDGTVETSIGIVKMGENQYFKMARQGRESKLGMVKPTLQNPNVVVEDYRPATDGASERDTSYIFVKTFSKEDGSRYYFTSVTVRKEGREVVISNQERSDKRISKLLQQGKVAWIDNGILHPKAQVGKSVSLNDSSNPTDSDNGTAMLGINSYANTELSPSSEMRLTEAPSESEGPDLVPTSDNIVKGKEREDGQPLILPSESSEEAGALSGPTLDSPTDRKVNTLSADKQTESAESSEPHTITPTTYTNKKGKTSDVHLVKFNRELTAEEKAALDTFAREPLTEGKKTSRGWYDRKQGGYMMRSEETAQRLGELIGHADESAKLGQKDEIIADLQPMTAEELREAVGAFSVNKPKAPANRASLEEVVADPALQHEISDDEMHSLLREIRDILGIGDDEGGTHIKFRDPGELTPEERVKLQSAGIRVTMGLISRGTTAFPDYATKMVGLLGDKIRPWLKSFYEGARWTPGYDKYIFTPTEQVATFDVQNFDKKQADPIAQAAMIVEERKASTASAQAQKELTEIRNKNRREKDRQREAATAPAEKDVTHNGYKIGDEVMWDRYGNGKWEKVKIEDFDADGGPIFEAIKGVISEKGDWSRVKPANGIFGEAQRVARATQEKKKSATPAKKKTAVNPEQHVADLFGGFFAEQSVSDDKFDEPISNEKKTDVQPRPGTAERERGHEPQSHEPLGESQRNEVKGTGGRGMGGRDSVNPMSDRERGAGISRKPKNQPVAEPLPESERKNVRNNHAERGVDYAPKGEDARIKANMEAIELAKRLLNAGDTATPEQMAVLRKFSGWGGLGKAFNEQGHTLNPIAKRLKELLGEDGYQDAVDSRRSAYYTPAEVIDTMWDVARAMGFNGGNVLEGSAGIGNIIGLMPTDMSERSSIHAVEIDRTTGGILSLLYPDAKVEIQGFEKTRVQNGTVDLAITNVPFITGAKVFDETGDKDLSKKFHDIHDFCIAKNIRKLREGGIGIFITSSGTMDNSKELRLWIIGEGNADVVGAFRMHNKTFGGTGATSDIIVVRKRVNGKPSPNAIDVTDAIGVRVADYNTGDTRKVKGQEIPVIKQCSMMYNKYFAEHPENMAGEMMFNFERGETRFPTSRALFPVKEKEQSKMLTEWASSFADMKEEATTAPKVEDEITRINEQLGEGVKEGSMVLNSQGELCMARMGEAVPLGLNKNKVKGHTKAECFKAYSAIKKALSDVLEYQSSHEGDEGLAPLLKELNRAFDTFTRTYGNLHKNTAISFLRNDVDFSSILALETYSETGDKKGNKVVKVGKTDIFSRRVIDTEKEPQPTTIKDAILASLYKSGGVDVEYIGQALGKPTEGVKREIVSSGLGFENPSTGTMEVSYKYLSGNVREKLHIAQENNADGRYDANIKALEGVMPMTIPAHLIEFSLGSSWIEPKLYEDFVFEKTGLRVTLTNAGGTWFMKTPWSTFNEKNRAMAVVSKMCDKTIMGHELIEAAITNRQITVSKTEKHYDGSTETITDKAATAECGTKVDEIRAEFKDWAREHMQADPAMSARIEQTYNDQFNNYVPMSIPDEFVPQHFGGQVSELHGRPFALRPHQGRAVVRGTTEPILLAHEVGTGKTYTLITTAMEMRRLGTARKPMIVVQNATVGQFVESAKEIYPNAKVLTIEEADRTAEGRKNFYAKIKYNDWDMIVVPQSVFERIPDSEEREMAYVKDIIEEKMKVLEAMRDADLGGRSMIVRQAESELAEHEARLAELTEAMQDKKKKRDEKREATTRQNAEVRALEMLDREVDDVENFDDMGIDAILVDEAHEYKHLGFATAMQRGVKGVDPSYSKKSQGVFLKAQAVMERNNGRNVVFATGTPISNTAAEIWTFMRYLMPVDTMKSYGIYYFDDFVRNFGNIAQMVEFSTNGKFKENNRFAGYVNLPELVRIWSGVADTVLTREAGGVNDKIPDMEGGKPQDIYLPQTRALRSVMKYVKTELDRYENMTGKEKKENSHIPLTMYGIAKAAAVDVRLVVPNAEDGPNSKTNATVRETMRSLRDSEKYKGTVAIFCDNYQNKQSGFNLYEDIRKKLIAEGVPAEQIVVIKPGMTVKRKLDIFEKVNAGEIRVIMGSTFTLGTGVNIQERLHTLIHVDAPNRPMDYTQRNGRALRQGNLHKDMGVPVRIIRFGVEDSLDVTAYQRLKTKGAIADSIMNGSKMMQNSMENRVLEEEEDSFGDMTAQLSGSQYAILKNQAEREVRNLTAKQKGHDIDQIYVHNQLPKVKGFIKGAERRIEIETKNLEIIGSHFPDGTIKKITIGKLTFDSVAAMEDFFKEQNAKMNEAAENIREGADNYTSKLVVDVDGLKFEVTTTVSRTVDSKGQGTLTFEPERNVTYSCEELGIKGQAIKGNRLKNIMQKIAEDIVTGRESRELLSRGQQQLAHYTEERTQLEQRNGREFPHKQELAEAKERLAKYEEDMKKELAEKEAKYAELDKSVETASDISLTDEDSTDTPTTRDGNKYRDGAEMSDGERLRAIRLLEPIEVQRNDMSRPELFAEYRSLPDVMKDGSRIQFLRTAFGKNYKAGGLFAQVVPQLDELLSSSILAYSEQDSLGGTLRPDGTEHKAHPNVASFDNYVNKAIIDGQEYYVRMTVQKTIDTTTGLHSCFVSNVDVYEKTATGVTDSAISRRPKLPYDGVVDAKLQQFFERASSEALELDKADRVRKLSEKLNTPVRIVTEQSDIENLPSARHRRAKGYFDPATGEIVIVVPNNRDVADVDNTFVHEVAGHKGLRALIGEERFDEFLGEVYDHASNPIRKVIDKMTDKMVNEEADRLRVRKAQAHERAGEDVNANYYTDMAEARVEAEKKREEFRKEATEEYMSDLGGRIGSEGFEKMSRDELTLWGKIKAKVQAFLDKFLQGLKIAKSIRLNDKDLSYILYKSWKNLRKKGVFADAEDVVMRRRTGWDDGMIVSEKRVRIDRLRRSESVEVTDAMIPEGVDLTDRKAVQKSLRETIRGVYVNEHDGRTLEVSGRGINEVTHHGMTDEAHVRSLYAIPEMLRKSTYVDSRRNEKGKNEFDEYRYYVCGLKIDGDDYTAKIVVGVKNGHSYYDHRLSHIEKGKLIDSLNAFSNGVAENESPSDDYKGMTLERLLQIEDEKAVTRFRDPGLGLEETITKMKAEAMQANAGNLQAKRDAMRAIGGNLNHLRQAMARQREYDITTVKSVADLARVLMDNNLLDDLSKYETKRILGAINNVVGKQDVSQYVQKVMDIMVDNQLRMGANTLGRLLSIRGSRVDACGIEVQGELDPNGQRIAQVVRKSTSLPKDYIDNRIAEAINRMSSTDQAIADEATIEYAGLQIARQYVEDITESKAEEKALRDSIREAKEAKDAGQMTEDAYRQYVESTEDAIRQNKIERAEAFHSLVEQIGGVLSESVERAKAWREAEKQRVEEIHHNANSDMEGRPTDEHHKDDRMQKMANNSFARFLLSPLATFDQMLRMFGKKNSRGEGYLWNRYMRDWVTATEKEYTGYRDALKVLDAKVSEIYGKDMTWGDLFTIDRKLPKASVRFFDGGEMKDHELTQGNMLYIYMADKMSDGRMKLRRMGITEEDIEDIKNFLDPKFMQLADWMQEEFLVDKRNEYNEVHKRMFGASMAAIENYFPLKILANARLEDVDVADDMTDTALPATSTGSIIKRRRNNLALDVTGANAFSVILDHLQQMERWAAFAEFNRDLNTLLSYKRFRNQVMNMSSVYGAGKTLWNNFRNVCSMAAGAYRPPIAALDKSAVNIAKGVTAAKVSFRVFTALKQFLSMPAYASDSNPLYLAANIANPIGAWRWSMENLPLFEKRWRSRMAGDPRLLKSEMDWKMWRSRVVELASRVGMAPNAFVDALTVAIGAHAMYQTKLAKYKRMGYDPDVAEERAKQDATILFNQTQQSSEGAFLSTMQVDRSWLSVLFTVFRNSSMSYTRQLYDSIRNIGRRLTPGYKALSEEFMAKQMRRDGIDPDKAGRNAKQEYRRGIIRDLVRVGIFGYVLQLAWNLGAYLPYLIFGDDDDEKDKMWDDVFTHTMFGSIEGLTGGDVYSNTLNAWAKGEKITPWVASKDMPLASDLENIWTKWNIDEVSAMNDVINLLVQSAVGVNPQSLTDAVVAVMDVCGDDAQTSRECALLMARVINCPQSQLDKIYFDELGATGEEASQMTPYEIAERYARYKVRRGAPMTGWAYGNEQREKIMDKYRKKSNTLAKERLTRETDMQASPNMSQWLEEFEATKDHVSDIKKVKNRDEDRYYELLDELEITPEYDRYEIIKGYKRDVDALTKEWLKATTPAQRDSCVQAIIGLKSDMVRELMNTQQ